MTGAIFFLLLGGSTIVAALSAQPVYQRLKHDLGIYAVAPAFVPLTLHVAMILVILLRHH